MVGLGNGLLLVFGRDPNAPPPTADAPLTLLREVAAGLNVGAFPLTGAPGGVQRGNARPSLIAGLAAGDALHPRGNG